MSVFSHHAFQDHEHVAFKHDKQSGLKAIIAIHNTNLGPALGGCRMWPYKSEDDAIRDVLRLSHGMTYKSAICNLKLGGGKSVIIADPHSQKSDALFYAMGEFIDSLGGRYITAEDSGTSVADIALMGKRTSYISGVVDGGEHGGDPSPTTAYGVFIGLKTAVQHRLGRSSLTGLKVAVQGVGNVGYRLAQQLHECGAELFVSDIYQNNIDRAVENLNATAVAGDKIWDLDVDVIAPCALGGVLNDDTLQRIKAPVIAGAANNQLAEARHGTQLTQKGILYAPDYVINAGGIIDVYYQRYDGTAEQLKQHVETIADTLQQVFDMSQEQQRPTAEIANQIAEQRFLGGN